MRQKYSSATCLVIQTLDKRLKIFLGTVQEPTKRKFVRRLSKLWHKVTTVQYLYSCCMYTRTTHNRLTWVNRSNKNNLLNQSFKPLPLCIVFSTRESQQIQSRKLGLSSWGHKNDNRFLRRMFYDRLVGGFRHGYQTRCRVSDVKALWKTRIIMANLR